jgi:hypothetical protein
MHSDLSIQRVKTLAEFEAQEKREWQMFDFKKTLEYEDYRVTNNGTPEDGR